MPQLVGFLFNFLKLFSEVSLRESVHLLLDHVVLHRQEVFEGALALDPVPIRGGLGLLHAVFAHRHEAGRGELA